MPNYTIRLQPKQLTFQAAEDIALLDAALLNGHSLPYGCRNGRCGACKATIITGQVHYPDGRPDGLSEQNLQQGQTLLCCAHANSDLTLQVRSVECAPDIQTRVLPARVAQLERLTEDVMGMALQLPRTERLQFLAGQYIDILLRDGRRRSFSLANAPHNDSTLQLHIRQVPGGDFTGQVFNTLKERSLLRLEGPLGSFYLREESNRPIVMVAGGTGYAPIRGILEHAFQEGLQRPIHFYWGVRTAADLYDLAQLQQWQQQPQFTFIPVFSEQIATATARQGWVHQAVLDDLGDQLPASLAGHDIYIAGPPPMIDAALDSFPAAQADVQHIYFDSFEFAADVPANL